MEAVFEWSTRSNYVQLAVGIMVVKVECTHLSFRWIRTEVVLFIVWSKVVESIEETFYDNAEVTMLSSYTKVICIYEAACVITPWLVNGVDVKEEWSKHTSLWKTILESPPSAVLTTQLNEKASVLKHAFDQFSKMDILGELQNLVKEAPVVHCIVGS